MPRLFTKCWWRGFTLIELLLLIAIVVVLLATLLPALQKMREANLNAKSMSNLHQLVIGLHDFGDAHDGTLPPNGGNFPYYKYGKSWVYASSLYYYILPFIKEKPLYERGSWKNYSGATTPGYPDDSNDGEGSPTYWGYLAGIDYGSMPKLFQAPNDPTQRPGGSWHGYDGISYPVNGLAFPSWQETKFPSSFPDGTSQTIFFAEGYGQVAWPGSPGNYVWRSWWRYTSHRNWHDGSSDMWAPDYIANPTYNPPFQVLPPREQALDFLPQGLSKDGIAIGLGDGTARIVSAGVSPKVWYDANTPAGNCGSSDW